MKARATVVRMAVRGRRVCCLPSRGFTFRLGRVFLITENNTLDKSK